MSLIEIDPFDSGREVQISKYNRISKYIDYEVKDMRLYNTFEIKTVNVNGKIGYIGCCQLKDNKFEYFDKRGEIPEVTYKKYAVPNNFGTVIVAV